MAATQRPSFMREDGTIPVKPGDMISKYCMAMYGNYGSKTTTWPKFKRFDGDGNVIGIANYDQITAGEILVHDDFYKSKPGKGGNGGGPNVNPPGPKPDQGGGTAPPGGISGSFAISYPSSAQPPLTVWKYFAVRAELSFTGYFQSKDSAVRLDFSRDGAKLKDKLAAKVFGDIEAVCEFGLTDDDLGGIAAAAVDLDPSSLVSAIAKTMKAKVQSPGVKICGGRLEFTAGVGFEAKPQPALLYASLKTCKGDFLYDGSPVEFWGSTTLTFKVGLSRAGWGYLAQKIGKPAVRALTQNISAELAMTVAQWGVFVILAAGATIVTEQLFEWLVGNAQLNGNKVTAAHYYGQAYAMAVFERRVFRLPTSGQTEMSALFTGAVESALEDVIADMRGPEVLLNPPSLSRPVYRQGPEWGIDPAYLDPAREDLRQYEVYLTGAAKQEGYSDARNRVVNVAWARARQRFGV